MYNSIFTLERKAFAQKLNVSLDEINLTDRGTTHQNFMGSYTTWRIVVNGVAYFASYFYYDNEVEVE